MKNKSIPIILYEDNHLMIVDKPGGLLVQGDKTGDATLLDVMKDHIKKRDKKPGNVFLGCVHRLDRPVSGICILAKTSKGLERMNKIFAERKIRKIYRARVEGVPAQIEGDLEHWLIKDGNKNKVTVYQNERDGAKRARLNYKTIEVQGKTSVLEVELYTGRSHQIRAQLASIGHPIIGDVKYGSKIAKSIIDLWSYEISFLHPIKKTDIHIVLNRNV